MVLVLLVLAAGQVQGQGSAPEGPSFRCDRVGTATETAICGSARLSRLERWVVRSYEGLADRIGQPQARAIADEQLALRQACEGEVLCIEARLIATVRVFEAKGAPPQPFSIEAAPIGEALVAGVPGPGSEPQIPASRGPPTEAPRPEARPTPTPLMDAAEIGSVAMALLEETRDRVVAPRSGGVPGPGGVNEPELDGGPDVALSGRAGIPPDDEPPSTATGDVPRLAAMRAPEDLSGSALARAFADRPAYRRVGIQGRLTEAGFGAVAPDGTWSVGTAAALAAFAREAGALVAGAPEISEPAAAIDPTTLEGAAALLNFIESDEFKHSVLGDDSRSTPAP